VWKRLRGWISGSPDPNNDDRARPSAEAPPALITLRNLEVAGKFPQELPDDAVGLKTGELHACASCGAALQRVIITTGGPLGDTAVWEAYPLALDGWQCERCENLTFPAFLSPDEMTALLGESVAFAQRGAFDEAELGFRRAIASWPTYMPARVNFGSMCLDRIRAEQQESHRADVVERYAKLAEDQLRKSLSCEPAAPVQARFMLGKLLCRRDQPDEGIALLKQILQSHDASPRLREEAESLLQSTARHDDGSAGR
jgi:tetratricopeptide (TPR) repeat protein